MPRPDDPEMLPQMAGERVFLADLNVGDVVDVWSRRSGGFFLQPDKTIVDVHEGEAQADGGLVMKRDANWGEIRRKCSK